MLLGLINQKCESVIAKFPLANEEDIHNNAIYKAVQLVKSTIPAIFLAPHFVIFFLSVIETTFVVDDVIIINSIGKYGSYFFEQ